jgi:hypothetical protein
MFLCDRVKETLGRSFAISYPDLQFESSRELLRTSPLYTRLEVEGEDWRGDRGCCLGMGARLSTLDMGDAKREGGGQRKAK